MAQNARRVGGLRLAGRVGRTRLLVILAMVGPGFIATYAGNHAGGTTDLVGDRLPLRPQHDLAARAASSSSPPCSHDGRGVTA